MFQFTLDMIIAVLSIICFLWVASLIISLVTVYAGISIFFGLIGLAGWIISKGY